MTDSKDIDSLLELYLSLLDEYTTLRSQISTLQTNIFQDIAKANFAAERGLRYGQDQYDDRMQAVRHLSIDPGEGGMVKFAVSIKKHQHQQQQPESSEGGSAKLTTDDDEEQHSTPKSPPDPLRWFGILTPVPLRQAQAHAITAVEDIIPRLVSVNAQMAEVEIQVRRARKKRAKSVAAEKGQPLADRASGVTA